MYFLLTTLKVGYVLITSTPVEPEENEVETTENTKNRLMQDNDDYICKDHILDELSDALFDTYQHMKMAKELWDTLETRQMVENVSSKKFLVSQFNSYKMVDGRSVMEQFHEAQCVLSHFKQHGTNMDESIIVLSIINKLPLPGKTPRRV